MDTINIILGISYIVMAIIFILLSIPLLKNKVGMNYFYGIRLKRAYESEESWYKINRYGARQFILWSGVLILAGIIAFFIPFKNNQRLILIFAVLPLLILLPVIIQTYRYSKKL